MAMAETAMSAFLITEHLQPRVRDRLEAQRPGEPSDEALVSLDELVLDRMPGLGRVAEADVRLPVAALQFQQESFHHAAGVDIQLIELLDVVLEELVER